MICWLWATTKNAFLGSRVILWKSLRWLTFASWYTSLVLSSTSSRSDISCTKEGMHLRFWRSLKLIIVMRLLLRLNRCYSCRRMRMSKMLIQLSIWGWLEPCVTCAIHDQIWRLVSVLWVGSWRERRCLTWRQSRGF